MRSRWWRACAAARGRDQAAFLRARCGGTLADAVRHGFRPLFEAAIPGPTHTITEGEVVATWPQVGPAVELATLDLATFDVPSVCASADLSVEPPGEVNAIALMFRAELYGDIAHTLDPWMWPASSWATSVWVLPDKIKVGTGSVVRVHYHRRVSGTPDGLTVEVCDSDTGSAAGSS